MTPEDKTYTQWKKSWQYCLALLGVLIISFNANAQGDPTDSIPNDPGAMIIYKVQDMSFGAFATGTTGGTITISNTGAKTSSGTVTTLNTLQHTNAIFEIDAPAGSIITVMNGPNISLIGSNGGSMTLTLGPCSPASPFITTIQQPARTEVHIGGTLTVGSAGTTPPGNYTGTFDVTFFQD